MKNSLRKLGKRHRRGKAEVPRDPPRLHTSTPSEAGIATPPFGKEQTKKKEERQEQSSVQLEQDKRKRETPNEKRVEDGQEKLQEDEPQKQGGGGREDTAEEEGDGQVKRPEEEGEEEGPKAENGGCREREEEATEEEGKGREEHPEEDAKDGSEPQKEERRGHKDSAEDVAMESLDEVNKHVVCCHPRTSRCLRAPLPRDVPPQGLQQYCVPVFDRGRSKARKACPKLTRHFCYRELRSKLGKAWNIGRPCFGALSSA